MIWFIISLLPVLVFFIYCCLDLDRFALMIFVVFWFVVIFGFVLLNLYGSWQLGWVEHCTGTFWGDFSCD